MTPLFSQNASLDPICGTVCNSRETRAFPMSFWFALKGQELATGENSLKNNSNKDSPELIAWRLSSVGPEVEN